MNEHVGAQTNRSPGWRVRWAGTLYAPLGVGSWGAWDADFEVLLVDPQAFLVFTPMLHEVASGSLDPKLDRRAAKAGPSSCRGVPGLNATAVDLDARTVTTADRLKRRTRTIQVDHLDHRGSGSQTRFPPGLRRHAHGMKTIDDALLLRNWLIGLLERVEIEDNPEHRRALLTVAVAGGGLGRPNRGRPERLSPRRRAPLSTRLCR